MLRRSRRHQTKVSRGNSATKTSRDSKYNVPHKPRQKASGPSKGPSKAIEKSPDHHEHVLSDTNIAQQGPFATYGPTANAPILFCGLGHPLRTDCIENGHFGANSQDQTIHANRGTNSPFTRDYFYNGEAVQEAMLTDYYPDTQWGDNRSVEN